MMTFNSVQGMSFGSICCIYIWESCFFSLYLGLGKNLCCLFLILICDVYIRSGVCQLMDFSWMLIWNILYVHRNQNSAHDADLEDVHYYKSLQSIKSHRVISSVILDKIDGLSEKDFDIRITWNLVWKFSLSMRSKACTILWLFKLVKNTPLFAKFSCVFRLKENIEGLVRRKKWSYPNMWQKL